jgi:predicted nucleotidyltransferase
MSALPEDWKTAIWQLGQSEPLISQIWVFGSRAKQTNHAQSDLDLAFFVAGENDGEAFGNWCFEAVGWQAKLALLIPVELHLHPAFSDDEIVMPAVIDHGIKIYP